MELTTELNGVKYLIVEEVATTENGKKLIAKAEKYQAIYQGVKELNNGGFWGDPYLIVRVLVPEKNVLAYNNED